MGPYEGFWVEKIWNTTKRFRGPMGDFGLPRKEFWVKGKKYIHIYIYIFLYTSGDVGGARTGSEVAMLALTVLEH